MSVVIVNEKVYAVSGGKLEKVADAYSKVVVDMVHGEVVVEDAFTLNPHPKTMTLRIKARKIVFEPPTCLEDEPEDNDWHVDW